MYYNWVALHLNVFSYSRICIKKVRMDFKIKEQLLWLVIHGF